MRAHEAVALEEFHKVLAAADVGAVSADHADALIRHLSDAPLAVQYGLGGAAWTFATGSASVDSYALENALNCAVGEGKTCRPKHFRGRSLVAHVRSVPSPRASPGSPCLAGEWRREGAH